MKKRDIKYIIKRVIIGVLIVLIVGSINKCNVHALTSDVFINTGSSTADVFDTVEYNLSLPQDYIISSFPLNMQGFLYNFNVWTSVRRGVTRNNDGYYFVLTSPDNAFKYYFFVYCSDYFTSDNPLVINAINFTYNENQELVIKFYNENGEEYTSENGLNYIYYNSFILTNKNLDLGIAPSFLEEYISGNQQGSYYHDYTNENEYFRLAYTTDTNSNNHTFHINFLPNVNFFNYMMKENSTIPFILINDTTIETLEIQNGFVEGLEQGNNSSIANGIIHSLDNNILGQYLEFITIPFNFLRSFTSSTCSSINITLPFVGGAITLPCISSLLNQYVPQLYNIIFIVVNGFLVYRITMRNIDTCTDVVKADDDKIEVVDL